MSEEVSREELARYLTGASSPEEAHRVCAWLDAHPQARLRLEGQLPLPDDLLARRDPEAALARLARRTSDPLPHERRPAPAADRKASDRRPARPHPLRRRMPARPLRIAAVVSLLALTALLAQQLMKPADEPFREIATERGQRLTTTLADGSTAELNVASRLRIPRAFGEKVREVYLDGEAFFDVASDPDRPFVIHSGGAVVEVVGTAFNVEAYADEDRVAVVVVEGRVSLRAATRVAAGQAVLGPGDLGRLVTGSGEDPQLTVTSADAEAYLAWRRGQLVFRGTPLAEVARTLARWYDVAVTVEDEALAARRLDATFGEEPLPDVLGAIAVALEVDYRIDGRRVTFTRP